MKMPPFANIRPLSYSGKISFQRQRCSSHMTIVIYKLQLN